MEPYKLTIDRNISLWDEAIPLGNAEIGCLLFGSAKKLTLSLDRGDIWDTSNSPEDTPGFTYENLIRLSREGKTKEIGEIFDKPYNMATPTKLPVGRLEMTLGKSSSGSFELDMYTAQATFSGDNVYLKTYTHATDGVGMIKTNCSNPSFKIVNPKFGKKGRFDKFFERFSVRPGVTNKLKNVKYPLPMFEKEQIGTVEFECYVQTTNSSTCFGIAAAKKKTKDGWEFAYYPYRADDIEVLRKTMREKVLAAIKKGYDALLPAHKQWWADYHSKSSVSLPDDYIVNRYNMGNYLLGSASRKGFYPMPLQGVWTACDDVNLPPWKGDYHHDLNTQMTYYSYLKSNHMEQGESFIDYLSGLTPRAKEFAKKFYNAEGICFPSVMDIDGYALGGWAMYALSPTNQMWLAQAFERHYSYSGDKEFLEKTAYPFMEQSAKFILSLLNEDDEGYLVLPISSSPEIHDNTLKAFLLPNSNYDEAMLLYIFGALEKLAPILGKDASLWTQTLKKLRPLAVNDNKVLRISRVEDLNESHRHQSHAMSIHPLRLLDYSKAEDKEIIDATIARAVELGSKNYTGYSITWLAEFFAVAKNGDKALEYLNIFWKYFCSVNTFHLNGDYTKQGYSSLHYRPFTLEGNFCALDALQEMLLYSENGVIELFPALPSPWKNASFKTFRAWGGVLVSAEVCDHKLKEAEFFAENDVSFVLRGAKETWNCDGAAVQPCPNGLKITMKKGEKLSLSAV